MPEALTRESIVALAPHAQLRFDATRQAWMLLGPERVYSPTETAVEILQACDGTLSIAQVAQGLADRFNAPVEVIERDSLCVLAALDAKGYLRRAGR